MEELFFSLIQVALGRREALGRTPTADEWRGLYRQACRQTLAGVLFAALERLPADERPPRTLLLEWFAMAERIRQANGRLNREAATVSRKFRDEGFRNVVLKGQGCALLYPDPLLRTPGDIDIWLEGGRTKVLQYVRRHFPDVPVRYHHTEFPICPDVSVEVHFTPSWMNRYDTNCRLQRYFSRMADRQFTHTVALPGNAGTIQTPTDDFNRVYLLVHIYRHLFGEGIGLRQLLDYYYVLQKSMTEQERATAMTQLAKLRMTHFAGAVMYVLQEVFGLQDECLLCPPERRRGLLLLDEIMMAGNFGHYDVRITRRSNETATFRFARSLRRNVRFLRDYPSEVAWDPVFKIWLYAWRCCHGYMGKG